MDPPDDYADTTSPDHLATTLLQLEADGVALARNAKDSQEVEALRVEFLGRNGRVTRVLRSLGSIPAADRPAVGAIANQVKGTITLALEERANAFTAVVESAVIDLSLPGRAPWRGGLHPVRLVTDEICEIFRDLGFSRVAGPEAETVEYNFTKLNFPLDHPAADMHDTFYLDEATLLRTHTSPMQARIMEAHAPPIRVVIPGTVYRRDPFDASHAPAFEQIEGLAVDEHVTFADFKATLSLFVRRFFGAGAKTRFRPSYFPFTEPSAEVDVSCQICGGSGCSACKGTGWMEIMGAGMVHPNVFRHAGIDPERFTGYAFGMGPGRIAMQRYGITDIRLLYEGDVRFLGQFA